MKTRQLLKPLWLAATMALGGAGPTLAGELPRVEDEALLALLNCES